MPKESDTKLQRMEATVRFGRDQARLEELLDNNTKQATWLSTMIQYHYAYRRLHKETWNKYRIIAKDCDMLFFFRIYTYIL